MPRTDYGEAGPALLSRDRVCRYTLERVWDDDRPRCAFIGLNPSTADEKKLDPTLRRCVRFADAWGYGSFIMLNAYPLRSTNWRALLAWLRVQRRAMFYNDIEICVAIQRIEDNGGIVVCCWGSHVSDIPGGLERAALIRRAAERPYYIALTKQGHPGHPLYLSSTLEPNPWT